MELLENWLLMAVLTPTFWAIGCLLDSCLIGAKIYRAPIDGAIVSCLFCIVPVVLALGMGIGASTLSVALIDAGIPAMAIAAGFAFAVHLYFYFRTLYCLNDVSGAETFITLSVLIVPLFAWLILDEVLPAHFYLAFLIAATGVLIQSLPVISKVGFSLLANLIASVVAVSLSMVLQTHSLHTHGFMVSTLGFNLTCFAMAIALLISNRENRRRIGVLCRRVPMILIAGEALGVLAVLSSHRATEQGPSVSIVAMIECLLPLVIIAISFLLIKLNRYSQLFSSHYQSTLTLQLSGISSKAGALTLLIISFATLLI